MNQFEENIQSRLTDEKLIKPFEDLAKANPNFTYPVNNFQVGIEKTLII